MAYSQAVSYSAMFTTFARRSMRRIMPLRILPLPISTNSSTPLSSMCRTPLLPLDAGGELSPEFALDLFGGVKRFCVDVSDDGDQGVVEFDGFDGFVETGLRGGH